MEWHATRADSHSAATTSILCLMSVVNLILLEVSDDAPPTLDKVYLFNEIRRSAAVIGCCEACWVVRSHPATNRQTTSHVRDGIRPHEPTPHTSCCLQWFQLPTQSLVSLSVSTLPRCPGYECHPVSIPVSWLLLHHL